MTVKCMRTLLPLVLLAGLVISADAALTSLPKSSYYSGTSYFSTGTQAGRVEFAVYDTLTYPSDISGSDVANPGTGRYVYAYQIFNYSSSIPYFVIQGLGANALTSHNDIDAVEDGSASVSPTSYGLNASQTSVVFEFYGGILAAGDYSWYLLLSSDQGWVQGSYSLTAPSDSDIPKPDGTTDSSDSGDNNNPVPEPASLLLIGLGAAALLKRKQ